MTIPEVIKKAIEGGWKKHLYSPDTFACTEMGAYFRDGLDHFVPAEIFLDSLFWQSLGKAMGRTWNKETGLGGVSSKENRLLAKKHPLWKSDWHRFIDHLASGGSIEGFFEKL